MNIQDHAHCEICGKVVELETRWCSKPCETKHEEIQAEKKKSMYKFVLLISVIAIVFAALNKGWL